jgi:hypothetical protein
MMGLSKDKPQKMNYHWIGNAGNTRMYWCGCMPEFRVGSEVHSPRTGKALGLSRVTKQRASIGNHNR